MRIGKKRRKGEVGRKEAGKQCNKLRGAGLNLVDTHQYIQTDTAANFSLAALSLDRLTGMFSRALWWQR